MSTSASATETNGLPQPGDVVADRYRIEAELGSGAMGVVYSAFHVDLAQRVAIKFLRPDIGLDKSNIARFMREARTAAAVKSEHVVRVYDVAKLDSGTPYLVMEHLSGADLHEIATRRGSMPFGELCEYIVQACDALAQVHAAGVVHRDLKPGNLFIARRGDGSTFLKVLDFGVSKVTASQELKSDSEPSLTGRDQFVGSTHYMSPEQLRNPKSVDARTDIWALGVIMYKLVSGRHPFHSETVVGCFDAIMNEAPAAIVAVRPEVPAELDRVIMRCLEKDVLNRFQNVAELAEALLPFAPPSAQPLIDRIRGVLIGSDAISADTRFLTLDSLTNEADRGGPNGGAGAPGAIVIGAPETATDHSAVARVPGPAFRRAPARSKRTLLAAGIAVAVLAIGGGTTWALLATPKSDSAPIPLAKVQASVAVATLVREISATQTAAGPGESPTGPENITASASSKLAADQGAQGTSPEPMSEVRANSPSPQASVGAAPSTGATSGKATGTTGGKSTGKAALATKSTPGKSGSTVASKSSESAAASKASRAKPKAATPAPRKRPAG